METIESNMKLIIQRIRRSNALYAKVARVENMPVLPPLLRSLSARPDPWPMIIRDSLHSPAVV